MNSVTIRNLCVSNADVGIIADAVTDAPKMRAFLVRGTTWSDEDHGQWVVGCFSERATAAAFVDRLQQWCRDNNLPPPRHRGGAIASSRGSCPLDSEFYAMSHGVCYDVEEVWFI